MEIVEIEGQQYRKCTVKYRGMWLPAFVLEQEYKQKHIQKQIKKLDNRSARSSIRNKLWTLVSEYIRKRDHYTCVTCGARPPKVIQAGHYFPKSAYSGIYFDERNIHAQCAICNMNMEDPKIKQKYTDFMINKYGQNTIDMLEYSGKQKGVTNSEMELLIIDYRRKLNEV